MQLNDAFTISAPPTQVWTVLDDVYRLSECVPGVEGVEETGPDTYTGLLVVKVGPISSRFSGKVHFIERIPAEKLVAEVEGQDKTSATFITATFTGVLAEDPAGTALSYEVDVALRGRLAQFGLAVVQATAKKLTREFAKCLEAKLSVPAPSDS